MAPIKKRSAIKKSNFAIKAKGGAGAKYPIQDLAHARNALARVSQYGTPTEKRQVARAVKKKYPALAQRSAKVKQWLG
jgi:hypothetical protein